jgi:hypothetical protein
VWKPPVVVEEGVHRRPHAANKKSRTAVFRVVAQAFENKGTIANYWAVWWWWLWLNIA